MSCSKNKFKNLKLGDLQRLVKKLVDKKYNSLEYYKRSNFINKIQGESCKFYNNFKGKYTYNKNNECIYYSDELCLSILDRCISKFGNILISALFKTRNEKKDTDEVVENKSNTSSEKHGGDGNSQEVDSKSENPEKSDNSENSKTSESRENSGGSGESKKGEKSGKNNNSGNKDCCDNFQNSDSQMVGNDLNSNELKASQDLGKKSNFEKNQNSGDKEPDLKKDHKDLKDSKNFKSKKTSEFYQKFWKESDAIFKRLDRYSKRITPKKTTKEASSLSSQVLENSDSVPGQKNQSGIFGTLSKSKNPTNSQVKKLEKWIKGFLPISGDYYSRKINPEKLVKILLEKSVKIEKVYEKYTKETIFILADVSGSCSAAATETIKACEIIASTLDNVNILLHANGEICEGYVDNKYFSYHDGYSEKEFVNPYDNKNNFGFIDEFIKKFNCKTVIAFGDFDAYNEYINIAKKSDLIVFDSYCANLSDPKRKFKDHFYGKITFHYVIAINSLEKMLEYVSHTSKI